jgi:glyoxylase-like metal-dependent hydrolase (beta-lactamase superfamily II)
MKRTFAMPILILAAAALAGSLALAQAPTPPPSPTMAQPSPHGPAPTHMVKEGTTVKISEHVYLIPDEKQPQVPNVGIIVGTRGTLVYDPGMGRKSGEAVLAEARKVSKGKDLYIINSHFHPEHTTGEMAFPADTRIIRATAQQLDIEELGMKWVQTFASRTPALAGVLEGVKGFRPPSETFEKEKMLDLGGVYVRIMHLGPGHTRGDTIVYVEQDRVLFSGDLAMKDLFPAYATPQSATRTWLLALDEMEKLKPRTVIGAHYPVGDASMISDYRNFLRALQARVAELKKEGKSSDDVAVQVREEFAKKYPGWAQPIRVHPAATVVYKESN